MLEKVINSECIIAIIIRNNYRSNNITFFTPKDFSQQLGYMNREKGYEIAPHIHNTFERKVYSTQEVLIIKSGKVRVDFYDNEKKYLENKTLEKGDIILLASGGHGFTMIEDSEIIEVKQGPYINDIDKKRFTI